MRRISARNSTKELRKTWKEFYIERGHVDVGAVSLVSDGSTGVLFNVAGMQPLMPYLLGEKHPLGTRLCNVQGCVRTNDIDSVGDRSHVTFFEMMGSWSLGDYFKEERCKWSYELLTDVFGFDRDHLAATVFAGDENAPRDEEVFTFRAGVLDELWPYDLCRAITMGFVKLIAKGIAVAEHIARLYPTPGATPVALMTTVQMNWPK